MTVILKPKQSKCIRYLYDSRRLISVSGIDCTLCSATSLTDKTRLWQNYSVTDGHTVDQTRVVQTSPHSKSCAS